MRVQRRLVTGAGALLAASLVGVSAASAASLPGAGSIEDVRAQATSTPAATAPAKGGGRPDDRPGSGRPEAAATGAASATGTAERGRPEGAGRSEGTAAAGGTATARTIPTLPPQASPRARAAVEAAAQRQALIRDRVAALKDIPKDADRAEAVKAVMADFGELFKMVADAVHVVEPRPSATPTATGTATATASATVTATVTATATATP